MLFVPWQNLKRRCDQESRDKQHSLEASKTLDNRKNNRYRDVNPYDHSRILLVRSAASDTDYINANLVKCERADRQYILTQGPLPLTVSVRAHLPRIVCGHGRMGFSELDIVIVTVVSSLLPHPVQVSHFWLMAWEQKSKAILMLNKLVEKKAVKCHKYWPDEIGAQYKLAMPDVQLEVEYVKYEEFDHFSIRTLLLTDKALGGGETREVFQFHYTTWPDFGIPSSPNDFLRFLKMVRDSGAMAKSVGPVIVHCSAGIGRSGTFCLVDCCLTMIEAKMQQRKEAGDQLGAAVSVSDVLSELRSYRMGLIQTPDQLYFSYRAIIDGVKYFNDEVSLWWQCTSQSPFTHSFCDLQDWCNTPISSTIKYRENGAMEEDEGPPPLPPPRTESLASTGEPTPPPRDGSGGGGDGQADNKWSQQSLPMAPVIENDDDDEDNEDGGSDASETDIESCNSSNEDGDEDHNMLDEKEAADIPAAKTETSVGSPTNGQDRSNSSDADMVEDSNDT